MRILCTNDDGYLSPGIRVLAEAASPFGEVVVVAPDREQSASSSALTMHRPLRMRPTRSGATIVDGTPTDCVILAVNEMLDDPPDLCVSGINHGPNMGEDVFYSGTVSAAMEATILGIPAVAFSHIDHHYEDMDAWKGVVTSLLRQILEHRIADHDLLNVNLPACHPAEVRGVRATHLGRRRYKESIVRRNDPWGREYFWIGGGTASWEGGPDSDFRAVRDGYVSVTPLHLDLTSHGRLDEVRGWGLGVPSAESESAPQT